MAGCRAATRWAAADVLRVIMRLGGWQTLFHDGDEKPWFIDRNDHKQLALGVRYHPPSHPRTQPSTRPPTYHRPLIATAVLHPHAEQGADASSSAMLQVPDHHGGRHRWFPVAQGREVRSD